MATRDAAAARSCYLYYWVAGSNCRSAWDMGGGGSSNTPNRRKYKDPDDLSGEELLEKLGHILAEGKSATDQADKLQEKVSPAMYCHIIFSIFT